MIPWPSDVPSRVAPEFATMPETSKVPVPPIRFSEAEVTSACTQTVPAFSSVPVLSNPPTRSDPPTCTVPAFDRAPARSPPPTASVPAETATVFAAVRLPATDNSPDASSRVTLPTLAVPIREIRYAPAWSIRTVSPAAGTCAGDQFTPAPHRPDVPAVQVSVVIVQTSGDVGTGGNHHKLWCQPGAAVKQRMICGVTNRSVLPRNALPPPSGAAPAAGP